MELILRDAEEEFRGLIDMVSFDNAAWHNWLCLHIESDQLIDVRMNSDILAYAEALFEHSFDEYEGRIYFCGSQDLYILARNVDLEEMREIGNLICNGLMFYDDRGTRKKIYDMASGLFELSFETSGKGDLFKVYSAPKYISNEKPLNIEKPKDLLRVLLVEDDKSTQWSVRKTLMDMCEFFVADDANAAKHKVKEFHPDLVFLDIGLPDACGREVLHWIRENCPDVRVVMLSSNNNLENISDTLREGATGFVAKPFLKENLLYYIHSYSGSA